MNAFLQKHAAVVMGILAEIFPRLVRHGITLTDRGRAIVVALGAAAHASGALISARELLNSANSVVKTHWTPVLCRLPPVAFHPGKGPHA